MDYRSYHCSIWERLGVLAVTAAAVAALSFLFYDSLLGILLLPIVFPFLLKGWRKYRKEKRNGELLIQFQESMQMVSNSLQSGYSMENAWISAEKELAGLYGDGSDMVRELHRMNQSVGLNQTLEAMLDDFAKRSGLEEIQNFSEVFSFAKRSGGNMIRIIGTTTEHIQATLEVNREIGVMIASKKMEQNVMNVVPIFILLYLRMTSMDYLSALYGNLFGVLFMSGCLILYGAAFLLSQKIMDIKV